MHDGLRMVVYTSCMIVRNGFNKDNSTVGDWWIYGVQGCSTQRGPSVKVLFSHTPLSPSHTQAAATPYYEDYYLYSIIYVFKQLSCLKLRAREIAINQHIHRPSRGPRVDLGRYQRREINLIVVFGL